MRTAFWLLTLFAIAVALALGAAHNPGSVTLYWAPYRVDLSLNLVLILLVLAFVAAYALMRGLRAMLELPSQAKRWRTLQRERAAHGALLDALAQQFAGRYARARKAAQTALAREAALRESDERMEHADMVRSLAHMVVAESTHALQDTQTRDQHVNTLLQDPASGAGVQEMREGAQLRAAAWAVQAREPQRALDALHQLPQGVQRRTAALRLRLKAAQRAQQTEVALDTARLLAKHGAFSPPAADALIRQLLRDWLQSAHDSSQLQRIWGQLQAAEQRRPDVALQAVERLQQLGGDGHDGALARQWLQPLWDAMSGANTEAGELTALQRARVIAALQRSFDHSAEGVERAWLERIERAQQQQPRDVSLQFLAGMVFKRQRLWGKAQPLLTQVATRSPDTGLRRQAWCALAEMAEARQDAEAAARAWREAAHIKP